MQVNLLLEKKKNQFISNALVPLQKNHGLLNINQHSNADYLGFIIINSKWYSFMFLATYKDGWKI